MARIGNPMDPDERCDFLEPVQQLDSQRRVSLAPDHECGRIDSSRSSQMDGVGCGILAIPVERSRQRARLRQCLDVRCGLVFTERGFVRLLAKEIPNEVEMPGGERPLRQSWNSKEDSSSSGWAPANVHATIPPQS